MCLCALDMVSCPPLDESKNKFESHIRLLSPWGTNGLDPLIREEQDLLEILDLELFGVKTLVSIEPSLATAVLLDSYLV